MKVREATQDRRSIRKYKDIPVEKDKIEIMLDSARLAPSGSNTQPARWMVIQNRHTIQRICKACRDQPFVKDAPLVLVLLGDLSCRVKDAEGEMDVLSDQYQQERERIIRDCAISGQQMVLQAFELGIGTCWVGDFTQPSMRKALNIPSDHYVLAIFTAGYPDEKPSPRQRHSLKSVVCFEEFKRK